MIRTKFLLVNLVKKKLKLILIQTKFLLSTIVFADVVIDTFKYFSKINVYLKL